MTVSLRAQPRGLATGAGHDSLSSDQTGGLGRQSRSSAEVDMCNMVNMVNMVHVVNMVHTMHMMRTSHTLHTLRRNPFTLISPKCVRTMRVRV